MKQNCHSTLLILIAGMLYTNVPCVSHGQENKSEISAAASSAAAGDLGNVNSDAPVLRIGPFMPKPCATLYLAVTRDTVARVHVRRGPSSRGDRLMIRAFDPEENLSFWEYSEPGGRAGGGNHIGKFPHNADIPLKGKGVNQIRITAGDGNCLVEVVIPEAVPYGISFQNGDFSAWEGQPNTMYAYVPPHAENLQLLGGPVRILSEDGVELCRTNTKNAAQVVIPVTKTDSVWSCEFTTPGDWSFQAWDFPLILCPTPDAARLIKASVEILPDGTVVCHKFQRRIAELLPKLLAPENVGTADELIVPLSSRKEERNYTFGKARVQVLSLSRVWSRRTGQQRCPRCPNRGSPTRSLSLPRHPGEVVDWQAEGC